MLALLIAGVLGQTPPAATDFSRCLREGLAELEPSQESASDIARSAMHLCSRHEPRVPAEFADAWAVVRSSFEESIVLHIVRVRACRRTTGCRVSDLPDPFGRPQ
jgi:hypothetical protein